MFRSKKQKIMTFIVLGLYLFLLIWLILFKFSTNLSEMSHIRNINLIPFGASMLINGKPALDEIFYNILVFIPFGVYIALLKPEWPLWTKIIPSFCLSLLFEILQFILAIGASDITDVIGNTFGGVLGLALHKILTRLFKKSPLTIINLIGLVIEMSALLMLTLLFIANR